MKRVQQLLEERQYIPSMAGILLAQNDSKIIGVVINDHEKYEGHTLEDQFISASVNALAKEIEKVCGTYEVDFMNAADYAKASGIDGIHMDEENHRELAKAVCEKINELYKA